MMQPDAGSGHQFGEDGRRRPARRYTKPARQPGIVRRVDGHLSLAGGHRVFGDQVLVMEDTDRARIQRLAHHHALARIVVRHRIAVAAITYQAVLGCLAVADVTSVVVQMPIEQRQILPRQPFQRDLPRRGVDARVGFSTPSQRLVVQLRQRVELKPRPEARLDIPDRRLDLALGLGPIRMTDPGHKAAVAG
jgi:hypothetical protein